VTGQYKIPFLDLVTPHRELEERLLATFRQVLQTAAFVGGPMVEEFETEFAEFCGCDYSVGVGSGTDALRFALMAVGVQPGDTVVTVPNTFIATAEAITQAGARPDFVDIDDRTYNLDPRKLQEYLESQCCRQQGTGRLVNRKTGRPVTAIIPVHLYGQMAEMDAIQELAERYNLFVVEDACQAHGATYYSRKNNRWMPAGSLGQAAAFSFYPGKNLGACGEAGAVTTPHAEVSVKIRKLRDHGQRQKYYHEMEGYNGRLDALQAGILATKLKYLPQWNQQRRALAQRYDGLFRSHTAEVILPYVSPQTPSVYHIYAIRVKHRDQLQAHLDQAGIGTGIHYPIPLHLQKAYAFLGYKEGAFPIAEQMAKEILSLPMYPQFEGRLQKEVVKKVIEGVEGAFAGSRGSLGTTLDHHAPETVLAFEQSLGASS
jgi:dTDP-4-amino-4,6-dideoxygalactose transaminase